MRPATEAIRRSAPAQQQWLLGAVALCAAAVVAALLADQPLVAVAIPLGLAALAALILWPEAVAPLVVFVLYANVAVVAVRFHDVPPVVGMLVSAPLVILVMHYVIVRRQPLVLTATLPALVLFLLLQLVSAVGSRDPGLAVKAVKTTLLEGLAIYLVVTNVVRSWPMLKRMVWALLAAGAIMGGLSAFQQATGTVHKDYGGFAQVSAGQGVGVQTNRGIVRQRRLCGPIGEQNRYAQIMLMLLPLGVFSAVGQSSPGKKTLLWTATALTAAGCALTSSRGAAVGFILMILVMAAMRSIKWRHLAGIALATALLMTAVPQYRTRILSIPSALNIFQKYGTAADEPDGAIRGRATAMLAAVRVWADHPVFGVGPGMFNSYSRNYGKQGGFRALEGTREAHNLYLEIAAEQGVVGLIAFLAAMSISFSVLIRARRAAAVRHPEMAAMAVGFILALTGYLTTGLFLHFSYIRYFWLMLALADAAAWIILRSVSVDSETAHLAASS